MKVVYIFYNGLIFILVKIGDFILRKRKIERFNIVVCSEEKRKIIGDIFMRVWNVFFCDMILYCILGIYNNIIIFGYLF